MAQKFWERDEVIAPPSAVPPVAAGPAPGSIRLVVPKPPDTPPAQTPAAAEGDVLSNKKIERDLSIPVAVPGAEGYFFGPDGQPYKMPGLPDDGKPDPAITAAIKALGVDELLTSVGRARNNLGSFWATGVPGAVAGAVPGSPRNNLLGNLESLQGAVILEKLQALKEASATGASGMGALSEREGARLAAAVASLDPNMSEDELRTSLLLIERHARSLKAISEGKSPEDPEVQKEYQIPSLPGQEPRPEGDIGFSGRTIDTGTVPITPEQRADWSTFLRGFDKGELTPEIALRAWERITGRPADPAQMDAVVSHFNQTGEWSQDVVYRNPQAVELAASMGPAGAGDLMQHGATLGWSDQATGVGNAAYNALSSPFTQQTFDPVGAYYAGRDAQNMRLDQAREDTGWVGTGAEILGGFASGRFMPPGRGAGPPPGFLGRVGQGAGTGAGMGMVSGAGYGEDLGGTLQGAAAGAAIGGAVGGAIPVVGGGLSQANQFRRTLQGADANEVARRAVARAITDDGNTMPVVSRQMAEAQANGVPAMLADTGENVTGLLAGAARAPGPSRTAAARALEDRQGGLADRVQGAVTRDLGPASNPNVVADQLMDAARTAAAPLYQAAYARPGAGALFPKIERLLQRPSTKKAMERAVRMAREEDVDPTTLGFTLNQAGEVELTRVPSWQTLDYIKRGLDDVVESYRDGTSGVLRLDTEGSKINNTLRSLVSTIDNANPEYAAARAAWAGPIKSKAALESGLKSRKMTADDLEYSMRNMSPGERDLFALGNRRALVEAAADTGDTANVVNKVIGTGKKRAMLQRLHNARNPAAWQRFVDTLEAESRAFRTFRQARLGSPTAQNVADDANLAGSVGTLGVDMATTGFPLTTGLRMLVNNMSGRAGSAARAEVAEMLTEQDPAQVARLGQLLTQEARRLRRRRTGASRRAKATGAATGQSAGVSREDNKK